MSLAAPLLQLGPDSPGMAFGMREQLQLVLHFTHLPCATPNPLLLDQMCFLKKKKDLFVWTLCVKLYHSPDPMTVRGVMHMQHCTM